MFGLLSFHPISILEDRSILMVAITMINGFVLTLKILSLQFVNHKLLDSF